MGWEGMGWDLTTRSPEWISNPGPLLLDLHTLPTGLCGTSLQVTNAVVSAKFMAED